MSLVVEITAGEFEIGDESIPNASPVHQRRLRRSIWIDSQPVTWAHFEVFVAAGGYRRESLWNDDAGTPLPCGNGSSVDTRCRAILHETDRARRMLSAQGRSVRELPLTGVSWFEARAIARFFNARLPFEIEWEVAMRRFAFSAETLEADNPKGGSQQCQSHLGILQEWTSDAFSSKYWRSDFDRVGVSWSATSPDTPVVVRGASAEDMVQHVCCRRGEQPDKSHSLRSFRRVWEVRPNADLARAEWRSFESM